MSFIPYMYGPTHADTQFSFFAVVWAGNKYDHEFDMPDGLDQPPVC